MACCADRTFSILIAIFNPKAELMEKFQALAGSWRRGPCLFIYEFIF